MFIAILPTYYEIYAIGQTEEEVKKNIVKGYKKMYPRKEDRSVSMDACPKIWFYTPLQLTAQALGIIATFAGILALATIC